LSSPWAVFKRVSIIGIAHVSFDGVVLRCNDEFARLIGDDPTHLIGQNVVSLTSPEDRERARVNLANLGDGTVDSIQHEKRYVSRAGHEVPVRGQFIAVRSVPEPYITSFIYEYDPDDSHVERIQQLESLIAELLSKLQSNYGVNVNVTGQDNSNNATADNQSQASISNQWNQPPRPAPTKLIGVILAAAALVAALVAWMRS